MKHIQIPKGYYLFTEGENSKELFGLIRGKIALTENKIQKLKDTMIEKIQKSSCLMKKTSFFSNIKNMGRRDHHCIFN